MQRQVLTEVDLHYGIIDMPKGFEIDSDQLIKDTLNHKIYSKEFPFSRTLDMLHTYLREHISLEHQFNLVGKTTTADYYKPGEDSVSMLQLDPVDLRNAPDYVMLYGIDVAKDSCTVVIDYDDNRRKGRSWEIKLNKNNFIMFPSTQRYYIKPNTSDKLNFVLTSTYEFI